MTAASTSGSRVLQPAVVWNPSKVGDADQLREEVAALCESRRCAPALWFETTPDDPGAGQTRQALAEGADLILVVGGDGTVSACAGALAGSSASIALLPEGTGNLLARNLELPLDLKPALEVAFGPGRRTIDVIETQDGRRFVIMAGLGFDAAMIRDTDEQTKSRIGWAAYIGGITRALHRSPRAMFTISVDDGPTARRTAVGVLAGNVGQLQGGLAMLPQAQPDDGIVDLIVLSPRTWRDWALIAGRLIGRRPTLGRRTETMRGSKIAVAVDRRLPLELDGELQQEAQELNMVVLARAVTVCVPT